MDKFESNTVCVLVIDDDVTTRMLLVRLLTAMGAAKVMEAGDGIEGLRMAFGDIVPDLIICDLNMEPLDGLAVVGAIRTSAKPHMVKFPIVIFSAAHDDAVMRSSLQAGATGAIPKPFNPKGMAEYLREIIRRKEDSSDHLEEFRAAAKLNEEEHKVD